MLETKGIQTSTRGSSLADVLEVVLEKGVVIAGDIQIKLADVELLTIKIRLLIASVDKAKEMGIDWWEHDSYLSSKAKDLESSKENAKLELSKENAKLVKRLESLEDKLKIKRGK